MFERLRIALGHVPASTPAPDVDPLGVERGLIAGGQGALARASLEARLARLPHDADTHALLGCVLLEAGDAGAALVHLRRAIATQPHQVDALNGLGLLFSDDHAAAVGWLRLAMAARPDNRATRYNLAQQLFFTGEFAEGFELFSVRHRLHHGRDNPLDPMPLWNGESLAGRHVFVWCDWGGFGDHLQFVSYLATLLERARPARLTLGAQPPLQRLFAGLTAVDRVIGPGQAPEADVHCPLFDLPRHFGAPLIAASPWLRAPESSAQDWRQRLKAAGAGNAKRLVGLAWTTGSAEPERAVKNVPPRALGPLGALTRNGVSLVSLNPGAPDAAAVSRRIPLIDLTADVCDFADTAAIIDGLDAVLAIDTAVAHLAAAMGKPVWLLLRPAGSIFLTARDGHTPWYPSMRIIVPQQEGAWEEAVARAVESLAATLDAADTQDPSSLHSRDS
ncbi:MAG: hypothetical protein JNM79_16950 [Burkholderiales bacterium]|nr:hypothetical protein [Burkholderiales bacterium]